MYNDQDYVRGGIHNPESTPLSIEQPTPRALQREVELRIANHTHRCSMLSSLPTSAKYWAVVQGSFVATSHQRNEYDHETTVSTLEIVWFDDEEALQAWVLDALKSNRQHRIFRAEPVKTEVKTVFSIQK